MNTQIIEGGEADILSFQAEVEEFQKREEFLEWFRAQSEYDQRRFEYCFGEA